MRLWPGRVARQLAAAGYDLQVESGAQTLLSTMERLAPLRGDQQATSVPRILRAAWKELGLTVSEEDAAVCLETFYAVFDTYRLVDPQARPLLAELHGRGLKLGSISNTIWEGRVIDQQLSEMSLLEFLPVRVYSSEAGVVKPERAIFEQALERSGVSPTQGVFVGDNLKADVAGAQRVGMKANWRQGTDVEEPRPSDIAPDGRIRNLNELPTQLDRLFPGWQAGLRSGGEG